jgi:hypothetical protein
MNDADGNAQCKIAVELWQFALAKTSTSFIVHGPFDIYIQVSRLAYNRTMTRDLELDLFRIIQRRQQLLVKVGILSLSASAVFLFLTVAYRWPLFLALIPVALTGPFVVNVASARCPHCQRPLHRTALSILRSLHRCGRCGFPR